MGEACRVINKGMLGILECMGEWEWHQVAFNGPKEPKTLKYNAWEPLVKPVPFLKEWECPKDKNVINEGTCAPK